MTIENDRRRDDRVRIGTILVVDDSATTRRILSRTLVSDGYAVREAVNGREAIDSCRERLPDLVLLDVDMPVLDGMSTLREMKDDPDLRALPVLFLTARTGSADLAEGLEMGAQDYLRKPCEPAELRARVAAAMRMKAQQEMLQRQARALDELSTTDALTGLGNRRRLTACVEEWLARRGAEAPVAVMVADIDHFKHVNDRHGHAVGDLVLRGVAERLRALVTLSTMLVRWGGEEFVVIAVGLETNDDARAFGEAMRSAIGSSPFAVGVADPLPITLSIGVAVGPLGDFDAALALADAALYDAKRNGRDRVEVRLSDG